MVSDQLASIETVTAPVSPTATATTKRGRKPKYIHTILLEGVNARELYKKFKNGRAGLGGGGLGGNSLTDSNLPLPVFEYSGEHTADPTCHTELITKKPSTVFLDAKVARQTTFVDYVTYGSLPYRTDLHCWHDHHTFTSSPIGCPIRFVDKTQEKHQISTPVSTTTAGNVAGNGNGSGNSGNTATSSKHTVPLSVKTNSHYLTIGTFCSFPCVLAFINRNKHDNLFRDSKALLYSMYYKLYGTELKIKPASDWQTLKNYGGALTIEEFRRSFCACNYVITPDVKRPFMVSVGKHVEAKQCNYF